MFEDLERLDLRVLLDLVPLNIYVKTIDGKLVYCNQNQLDCYKVKCLTDVIGKSEDALCEFLGDVIGFRENDNAAVLAGKPITVEEPYTINNSHKTMLSHKVPVKNKAGVVIGIFGISIDITDMKHKHFMLQNTFDSIISRLPGHVYWLDKHNVWLGCNDAQAKDAGYSSPEEIIGKTNSELPWFEHAETLDALNNTVMETGEEHISEEESVLADGSRKVFYSIKSPLYDENNDISGTVGLSIDITDKKKIADEIKVKSRKLEAALEAANTASRQREETLALYRQFVEDQEHDIRTPLG